MMRQGNEEVSRQQQQQQSRPAVVKEARHAQTSVGWLLAAICERCSVRLHAMQCALRCFAGGLLLEWLNADGVWHVCTCVAVCRC
jgi:uncharacterized membrane protein YccC